MQTPNPLTQNSIILMNKFFLLIASVLMAMLLYQNTANAQRFNVTPSCTFTNNIARCEVYNHLSRPIYCRVEAYGMTQTFQWIGPSYYENWIAVGGSIYADVYTNYPYYFINVNGNAVCRF